MKHCMHGAFIPYPDNHRWAICVHGYRSNGKRDMAYTALRFAEEGYNVLVPDLRAHGKSSGNKIGMAGSVRFIKLA